MNNRTRRQFAKLRRIKQFVADNALTPANPAATAESTAISTAIPVLEELAESQVSGNGTVSGAVDHRLVLESQLRDYMSSLAKIAKTLDIDTHPDVASRMRMGKINSFEELLARANTFVSTLDPIKAEFIALGAATTVVADLQSLIDAFQEAGNLKLTGLDTQIGGTRGLTIAMRDVMKHARKLDAILCQVYRNNPVLLEQWKAAYRMERAPKGTPTSDDGNGSGSGSGTTPPVTSDT